ncbi:MmcQ/YjbR family DNA-binding protein [Marinactinospora rubrisoli]|uniref:MmcQ/YjbR family DNA-binding protein n=1 Tax=Marinactinospora rubrisoli TaxID=2715399 RepID=A0ABW2KC50_9ACTN
MGVEITRFLRLVDALPDAEHEETDRYTAFSVHGKKFGYLWPRTRTVGLKQTLSEQRALVAERPEVFEVQFTAGGFGWVVVHLDGIELDELSELVLEAWRLSASDELLADLPTPASLVQG